MFQSFSSSMPHSILGKIINFILEKDQCNDESNFLLVDNQSKQTLTRKSDL